ncbi:hypothetical protein NHH03_00080 [Stieleria sp. TO1_6]|uniref:hypothetical protein n=1 Tax=Stieleria tagensis TaxID=2956795 RepID=UPI00209AC05E|nr:hypothetical protein [Stieleria tagensis]MCO8120116.1 hypothetical protein [Stieleria tagensis]
MEPEPANGGKPFRNSTVDEHPADSRPLQEKLHDQAVNEEPHLAKEVPSSPFVIVAFSYPVLLALAILLLVVVTWLLR